MKKEKNCKIKMVTIYLKNQFILRVKRENIEIECSLRWNASYSEDVFHIQIIFIKKMVEHISWFQKCVDTSD